tara:strand:+ start:176 stop:706 length:531 start_codon:yes stop_codon:yes gene_type:complete
MPGRYATALFELALEGTALDKISKDLGAIEEMLENSSDLDRLVKSPVFSTDEQIRAISAVFKKVKISKLTLNFISLITSNRRLFALSDMIKAYAMLLAQHRGEISAEVTSAAKLSTKQMNAVKSELKAVVGRDVKLVPHVDPSLLGGLIVKVGSRMVDNSLKTKLDGLKIAMKEVG